MSPAREVKKLPTLRGKTVVNLFFEDSTRTRISFEAAAKRLERRRHQLQREGLKRLQGREPEGHRADPRRRWARMPWSSATPPPARRDAGHSGWITAGVVNAGDGTHEHPTQALLDAFTIRTPTARRRGRGRDLDGVQVTIVGDILHSRVARSNVGCSTPSAPTVHLVAPPTLSRQTSRRGRSRVGLRPGRGDRVAARRSS